MTDKDDVCHFNLAALSILDRFRQMSMSLLFLTNLQTAHPRSHAALVLILVVVVVALGVSGDGRAVATMVTVMLYRAMIAMLDGVFACH